MVALPDSVAIADDKENVERIDGGGLGGWNNAGRRPTLHHEPVIRGIDHSPALSAGIGRDVRGGAAARLQLDWRHHLYFLLPELNKRTRAGNGRNGAKVRRGENRSHEIAFVFDWKKIQARPRGRARYLFSVGSSSGHVAPICAGP
jgi:hypothetical protein